MNIRPELWVVKSTLKYRKLTAITIIGSLVDITLFTLPAYFLALVIQSLINADYANAFKLIGIYFIIGVIQVVFFGMAAYYNEVLAHRVTTDMTIELYKALQDRSLTYLDKFDIGQIMARATNDTRQINLGLSPAIRVVVQSFLQVIVITVLLEIFEPRFIPIFFIFVLSLFVVNYWYAKGVFPIEDKILTDFENISVIANETFNGIQELKSYNSEDNFIKRFKDSSQEHARSLIKKGRIQALYFPTLLFWIMMGVVAFLGILWMSDGSLNFVNFSGAFSAVLLYKFLSEAFNWAFTETVAASAASRRLYKVIFEDIEETQNARSESNPLADFKPNNMQIEFKNVSFRYDTTDQKYILRNLNLTIEPNQTVVLIGPPGSGKSTLNKLLLRLYKPSSGEILLGGRSIFDYNNSYQDNISAIEQNPFLFSETIDFNIRFGKPSASEEEIKRTLEMAQAQFVYSFPDQLQTGIGDRGVKLSGGEKQRLAIARALLLNPKILIMDDASSALDAKTEMMIQESISSILKERTAIITTHRLSIIAKADKIILLEHGEIVAQGTHKELITSSIAYRKLFAKQYELPPLIS